MSGQNLYYDLVSILRGAGCEVRENSITAGWQHRARSSGGFPAPPLATFWHHTASNTSVDSDLNYMINVNQDAPVGNLLLDRSGCFWPIAGGASNCAGKGNQMSFSRGVGASDSGNTWAFQVECQNDGVGQAWPEAQVSALVAGSNALNLYVGNQPSDITSHALGAGNGYTDRKIDPATAAAVQGPWVPRSTNSSGTWHLDDMRSLALERAGQPVPPQPEPGPTPEPEPTPPPTPQPEEDWMANLPTIRNGDRGDYVERMQHLLAAAGFMNPANTANYDGVWGSGTEKAKVNFDNAHGLTPSPPTDCGSKSWESLMTGRVW